MLLYIQYHIDCFFAGEEDISFGDIVISNGKYCIIAIRWQELCDKVHSDGLKGQGAGGYDWEEGWFCGVCVNFIHLAGGTPFDVGGDKVFHVRLPVAGVNKGKGV